MLIKFNTQEWDEFLSELQFSKQKSNKDVLCVKCWRVMNYEEARLHKTNEPSHEANILTSKYFASEKIFISLAKQNRKVFKDNSEIVFVNPYAAKLNKRAAKEADKRAERESEDTLSQQSEEF